MAKRSENQQYHHPITKPNGLLGGDAREYQSWRAKRLKLQEQLQRTGTEKIEISTTLKSLKDQRALTALCRNVRDHGFALYQWTDIPADTQTSVKRLNKTLGLVQDDKGVVQNESGLSLLKDMANTARGRFIPYTSRAMGWHTDGYYNDQSATLRSFSLHCINPAAAGGSLFLMDYELLMIALKEEGPELLELLAHPQCMTLPANKDNLGHDRPDRQVPVWSVQPDAQTSLRFTTRTQHISWRTADTKAAAECMAALVNSHSQWHHSIRLETGQGVITRNILHRREAFKDSEYGPPREMLRGRYLDIPRHDADLQP